MAESFMQSVATISNNKIKEIQKLHLKKYREELDLFLAEGIKSVEELIDKNIPIVEIYATKPFNNSKKLNKKITIIDEKLMKKISTTDSPCEIIAIAKKKQVDKNIFSKLNKIVLLDKISDPGNLGTIIRSAAAFGIDGIILFSECVELYSPKVIRSTTGNFFKLPIISIKDTDELKKLLPNHKFIATALSEKNNLSIKECANLDNFIVMFGSEAKGLCSDLIKIADKNIKLNMMNNVESINLSVCASIIFYELNN